MKCKQRNREVRAHTHTHTRGRVGEEGDYCGWTGGGVNMKIHLPLSIPSRTFYRVSFIFVIFCICVPCYLIRLLCKAISILSPFPHLLLVGISILSVPSSPFCVFFFFLFLILFRFLRFLFVFPLLCCFSFSRFLFSLYFHFSFLIFPFPCFIFTSCSIFNYFVDYLSPAFFLSLCPFPFLLPFFSMLSSSLPLIYSLLQSF